jgi:hypothetical protein
MPVLAWRAQARKVRGWRARATGQPAIAVAACRALGEGPCARRVRWRSRARRAQLHAGASRGLDQFAIPTQRGNVRARIRRHGKIGRGLILAAAPGAPDQNGYYRGGTPRGRAAARSTGEVLHTQWGLEGFALLVNRDIELAQRAGTAYLFLDEPCGLPAMRGLSTSLIASDNEAL